MTYARPMFPPRAEALPKPFQIDRRGLLCGLAAVAADPAALSSAPLAVPAAGPDPIFHPDTASIVPTTVQQPAVPRGVLRAVAIVPVPIGWTPAAPTMWPPSVGAREFNRRLRVRIRLLAFERGLPEPEIKPVIKLDDYELLAKFIDRHDLSYDWLFCGCLKGRLRMAKRSRAVPTLIAGGADA